MKFNTNKNYDIVFVADGKTYHTSGTSSYPSDEALASETYDDELAMESAVAIAKRYLREIGIEASVNHRDVSYSIK